jgi:beta-carotene 3-hydroxylase
MQILLNIGILILSVVAMEAFSWAIHKYLFHGPLWFIHKTHHLPHKGYFELNDIFSLGFSLLAVAFMWLGHSDLSFIFWLGAGISVYGIIYFVFHDCFVHNRITAFKSNNMYLWALKRAHKIHHKSIQKKPATFFGLLWFDPKKLNLPNY